jgi:AcrR family transcriptional regulator
MKSKTSYGALVSGTREAPDRSRQKARTRSAVVEAAAALLREGRQPTVAEAAAEAGVHRATAYRYFPQVGPLLAEAALTARAPTPAELVHGVPADDPAALLDAVVTGFARFAFAEEALVRTAVLHDVEQWFSPDPDDIRGTRRFDYLAPVLDAVSGRLDEAGRRRLSSALALTFGAEAVVVTRDVCALDPEEATETVRWAASALLRAALAEAGSESYERPVRHQQP